MHGRAATVVGPAAGIDDLPGAAIHAGHVFEAAAVIVADEEVRRLLSVSEWGRRGGICHEEVGVPEGVFAEVVSEGLGGGDG